MADQPQDDFEAVRELIKALEPFEASDQERIIRWAREKLGLPVQTALAPAGSIPPSPSDGGHSGDVSDEQRSAQTRDIKTFVAEKKPTSDIQFAVVSAYYYRFEAPQVQRKDSITSEDLLEACRQAGRSRLPHPGKTLHNAHNVGLLDKAGERGAYAINTVGENLVAMTLPSGTREARPAKRTTPKKASNRKTSARKKATAKKTVRKRVTAKKTERR